MSFRNPATAIKSSGATRGVERRAEIFGVNVLCGLVSTVILRSITDDHSFPDAEERQGFDKQICI
jgi:hypothetical protein